MAIFVDGRWAELGPVKYWAKSLHQSEFRDGVYFEKFFTKKSTHQNLTPRV
jgi:hypothetical protein